MMPTFNFTSPEGKNYKIDGPEGATKEQAFQILQTQIGQPAAPKSAVDQIPGTKAPVRPPTPTATRQQPGFGDKLLGAGETALSLGTGAVAGPVGAIGGVLKGISTGKFATDRESEKYGSDLMGMLTYEPRTEKGKQYSGALGDFFKDAGIEGIGGLSGETAALGEAANVAKPVIAARVGQAANAIGAGAKSAANLIPKKPVMAGVGAAETEQGLLRAQRAADLPVPIDLTKGQRNRTFEQQKFERETAKLKEGERLRDRFAEQNEKMLQNFDAFVDKTGAEQPSLRQVGEVVDKALISKVKKAKEQIDTAYADARKSGELNQRVKISSLGEYLNKNESAAGNAKVLKYVQDELKKRSNPVEQRKSSVMGEPVIKPNPLERSISLEDLEEIRKGIGKLSEPGTPNAVFGGEMKKLIDAATDGKGGEKYQQARRLHENYAKEFKDKATISKLLRNKPGTTDRAVAMEDVFDHSIMKGSLDDVRAVRRTLQTAGSEGEQAWKELQGQTVKNMKDVITSNSARDIRGNPIISPDKLNKLVSELDKDGKLDFIFGKKGASQIRDINDLAKDVYTSPPGSVGTSNTASILLGLLDTAAGIYTGVPVPVASAIGYGLKKLKSKDLSKKVDAALSNQNNLIPPPPKQP